MIVNKKTIWWKLHILCYSIHCVICDHHIRYKYPHCTISSIALLSSVLSISLNICSYSTIIYNIIIIQLYSFISISFSMYPTMSMSSSKKPVNATFHTSTGLTHAGKPAKFTWHGWNQCRSALKNNVMRSSKCWQNKAIKHQSPPCL